MKIRTLDDLFRHVLQETHSAERLTLDALEKMAGTARSRELAKALEGYAHRTNARIRRLEQILTLVNLEPAPTACPGVEGILGDADRLIGAIEDDGARDIATTAAVQTAKHYVLARYTTLASWGRLLRRTDVVELLLATLSEERKGHLPLIDVAEGRPDDEGLKGLTMGERLATILGRMK